MSAIFGIINKANATIDHKKLTDLQHTMAHRAVGGGGIWKNESAFIWFGRSATTALNVNEQLPLETEDFVLTADCRIDNRDELCSLLSVDKEQWQDEADSHILLKAYQRWGEDCVLKLDGEFSFAIWNKVSQKLFMATDPVGFRPLFYYDGPSEFIFCSEIKGIVAVKTTPNYFNEEHLIEYHFRNGDPSQTYNKDISALCGGSTLTLETHKIKINKYWKLENKEKYNFKRDEDWIDCLRHLMYSSVEKRLNPDVPTGVTLSGGLDSSSVTCILAELLAKKNKPLYAFSSVLPLNQNGIEKDERNYIDVVNKFCPNIIQTFVEAPGLGPFDDIMQAFERDESLPNSFFYIDQAILQAAEQQGIKSLFTGFGGDFLLSWSGNTIIYLLIQQGAYKSAFELLKQLSKRNRQNLLKQFKNSYLIYTAAWKKVSKLKPTNLNSKHKNALKNEFVERSLQTRGQLFIDQRLAVKDMVDKGKIGRYTGKFNNRNAYYLMASENPMFDKNLLEFLMEVPVHLFIKDGIGRNLIRQAMCGVIPDEIHLRKDKLPYSPDFVRRVLDNKARLHAMMDSKAHNFVFDKYFSKQIILQYFDGIKPHAGFNSATSSMSIPLVKAGIAIDILTQLKNLNYRFD